MTSAKSVHPDHPGKVPNTEHLDLPNGEWADLGGRLSQGQVDEIESAALMADYDVKGEYFRVIANIRGLLSAAPEDWRAEHFDTTMSLIDGWLGGYEATAELALAKPDIRAQYARANVALNAIYARVLTRGWFVHDADGHELALEDASWPLVENHAAKLIQRKAQRLWIDSQKELGEALKVAGLR